MSSNFRRTLPLLLAVVPLLGAAFPWEGMTDHAEWHRVLWTPFLSGYKVRDAVLNVLVTVPIGLVAARRVRRHPLLVAAAIALAVSLVCEWAQVYAPERYPSGTDLLCNTLGGVLGALFRPSAPQSAVPRSTVRKASKDP